MSEGMDHSRVDGARQDGRPDRRAERRLRLHAKTPAVDPAMPIPDDPIYALAKRTFDVVFSIAALFVTAPLCLTVAALVRLTSPGPAIFRQPRVGRGGRPFTCLKFRTMVEDAHSTKEHLRDLNEMDGPVFKIRKDPRVTRIGAWLRRLSIDEIPQFVNVLRGDMSIVGPRPPLPEEVERYRPRDRRRLAVTPGLTCLWQVGGRADIQFDHWVELDLEYIRRRGFWLDVAIVLRTIPAVISGRGAA
ncbi:MAG: sugar transferase [Candidatus Binatia bacterium]